MAHKKWYFIVDTEQYAGNFEREMGAYLTGVVGESFPNGSAKLAELFKSETNLVDECGDSIFAHMLGWHESDVEDEPSYVSISITPGWFNDGHGGLFREGEEEKAKEHYVNACLEMAEGHALHLDDKKSPRVYECKYCFRQISY